MEACELNVAVLLLIIPTNEYINSIQEEASLLYGQSDHPLAIMPLSNL